MVCNLRETFRENCGRNMGPAVLGVLVALLCADLTRAGDLSIGPAPHTVGTSGRSLPAGLIQPSNPYETWSNYYWRVEQDRVGRHKRSSNDSNVPHSRQKRFLSFPSGSYIDVEPEIFIPLFTQGDFSLRVDTEFTLRWTLPVNATFSLGRSGLGGDRLGIYMTAQRSLERFGLDGKACILRSICEAAEYPVENEGLLGEVLNLVLSASRTATENGEEQEYAQAEVQGRSQGNCWASYPDCPVSIFNLV